jgi:hypothetical protein
MKDEVIELVPHTDPVTGEELWTAAREVPKQAGTPLPEVWTAAAPAPTSQPAGLALHISSDGTFSPGTHPDAPTVDVVLTNDKFAGQRLPSIGGETDWKSAEPAVAGGRQVSMSPNGELIVSDSAGEVLPTSSVTLTTDRFASSLGSSTTSRLGQEAAFATGLIRNRVTWIKGLSHTTETPGIPAGTPIGWLFRPRPNRYRDELVCVIAYHPTTNLYHAHFWRYEADVDGRGTKAIDLPAYLGRSMHLTQHRAHMYTSTNSAVLCLSERAMGGMPTFDTALVQTMKWSDGTGEVIRGRPFPYK